MEYTNSNLYGKIKSLANAVRQKSKTTGDMTIDKMEEYVRQFFGIDIDPVVVSSLPSSGIRENVAYIISAETELGHISLSRNQAINEREQSFQLKSTYTDEDLNYFMSTYEDENSIFYHSIFNSAGSGSFSFGLSMDETTRIIAPAYQDYTGSGDTMKMHVYVWDESSIQYIQLISTMFNLEYEYTAPGWVVFTMSPSTGNFKIEKMNKGPKISFKTVYLNNPPSDLEEINEKFTQLFDRLIDKSPDYEGKYLYHNGEWVSIDKKVKTTVNFESGPFPNYDDADEGIVYIRYNADDSLGEFDTQLTEVQNTSMLHYSRENEDYYTLYNPTQKDTVLLNLGSRYFGNNSITQAKIYCVFPNDKALTIMLSSVAPDTYIIMAVNFWDPTDGFILVDGFTRLILTEEGLFGSPMYVPPSTTESGIQWYRVTMVDDSEGVLEPLTDQQLAEIPFQVIGAAMGDKTQTWYDEMNSPDKEFTVNEVLKNIVAYVTGRFDKEMAFFYDGKKNNIKIID